MKIIYWLLAMFLTSCTVGPNYHTPSTPLPAHYSEQTISSNKNHNEKQFWYASLNDPVLISLIERALWTSNLDLQTSLANLREARAELSIAKADLFPQLDASGKVSRDRISANEEILSAFRPGVIPLNYTDYTFGLDASWEIDIFGHNRRTVEAATAQFASSIESYRNIAIIVAAEIADVYTQYRVYQQRIILAQNTIHSYAKTVGLVKLQVEAGSATGVDLKQAESQLDSAKAVLPSLQAEAKAALASLAVLVGENPENLFKLLHKTAPIPVFKAQSVHVGLPSDLLRRRPDIRMAERNLAAATANVGVAVANLYPRFQLAGDLGFDTTKAGTYFDKASTYWSLGPHVSIPIFTGGKLRNAVKAQEALQDAARASYQKAILQALADVETSIIRYDRARVQSQILLTSYRKLASVHHLASLQYREGQSSLLNVLDVERQLYTLMDQYIQSEGQVTIDLVALYKALGGDWLDEKNKAV